MVMRVCLVDMHTYGTDTEKLFGYTDTFNEHVVVKIMFDSLKHIDSTPASGSTKLFGRLSTALTGRFMMAGVRLYTNAYNEIASEVCLYIDDSNYSRVISIRPIREANEWDL